MGRKLAHFLAIAFTAAAMVPGGAHLFAMAAKMGMAQEPYFTVQQIYRGWALFGIAIFGAIFANAAVAILVRHQRPAFRLAAAAALLLILTLAVFFTWTFRRTRPRPIGRRCRPTGPTSACAGRIRMRRTRC